MTRLWKCLARCMQSGHSFHSQGRFKMAFPPKKSQPMVIRPSVLICTKFPWATCLWAWTMSQSLPLFCYESGCFLSKSYRGSCGPFYLWFCTRVTTVRVLGLFTIVHITHGAALQHGPAEHKPTYWRALSHSVAAQKQIGRNTHHTPPDKPTAGDTHFRVMKHDCSVTASALQIDPGSHHLARYLSS